MTNSWNIEDLVPQRDPVLMVDRLLEAGGGTALTSFTVRSGNFFLGEDGRLEAAGLIEHIAQSASAYAGYAARLAGSDAAPTGYIGEVRDFRCLFRPRTGDEMRTVIRVEAEAGGVTLVSGETRVGDETAAVTRMKIFVAADGKERQET